MVLLHLFRQQYHVKPEKAKDVSLNANCLEPDFLYGFLGKKAKLRFYYGRNSFTKTANELKMIAAKILPFLQAGVSASNATRVTAFHFA